MLIIRIILLKLNNDQVKEVESSINNIQCMEFNELKIKLCKNLNIKPIIVTKIKKAENVNELFEIMKTSLKSQDDIFSALKTITIWATQNNKNDLNSTYKQNLVQREENIEIKKNLNNNTENDISSYTELSTSQMIKVKN